MLFSLGILLVVGFSVGELFAKIHLPKLVGMMLAGIILGPSVFNLISQDYISFSKYLREIALAIILIRAGLEIKLTDLMKMGRAAIYMSIIPGVCELILVTLIAPMILGVTLLEAAIMGAILAPVSAAVVIPGMLSIIQRGYGTEKAIPQMILTGTSMDDTFLLVMFYTLLDFGQLGTVNLFSILKVPVAMVLGVAVGYLLGKILPYLFEKYQLSSNVSAGIMLGIALLVVYIDSVDFLFPISSLLTILVMGIVLLNGHEEMANEYQQVFTNLWIPFQLLLFTSVGLLINIEIIAGANIFLILCLLVLGNVARSIGVLISLIKTDLTTKEKIFCVICYIPKATVQAALGGIPLAMQMEAGGIILVSSVLSILIFAPIGAILIEKTYRILLIK